MLGLEAPDDNRPWTVEEIELVEAIVEQMAQSAENLRLFDETRQQAGREQTIRKITEKMRASTNLEELIRTAAQELGEHLSAGHAVVELGIEMNISNNSTQNGS